MMTRSCTRMAVPLGILLLILTGCGRRAPRPAPKPAPRPPVSAQITNVHLHQEDEKGRPLWDARAEKLLASEEQKTASMEKVKVTLFREGQPVLSVSAPRILAHYPQRKLYMTGGVRARSTRGRGEIAVGQLVWNARTHRIVGEGSVRFRQGRLQITGERLVTSTELDRVQILGQPQMVIRRR